jgi:hypothetical protein
VDKSDFPDASTGHHRASHGHSRMPDVPWEITFNPGNPGSESNFSDVALMLEFSFTNVQQQVH